MHNRVVYNRVKCKRCTKIQNKLSSIIVCCASQRTLRAAPYRLFSIWEFWGMFTCFLPAPTPGKYYQMVHRHFCCCDFEVSLATITELIKPLWNHSPRTLLYPGWVNYIIKRCRLTDKTCAAVHVDMWKYFTILLVPCYLVWQMTY